MKKDVDIFGDNFNVVLFLNHGLLDISVKLKNQILYIKIF